MNKLKTAVNRGRKCSRTIQELPKNQGEMTRIKEREELKKKKPTD